jgi:HEAT repeat protein
MTGRYRWLGFVLLVLSLASASAVAAEPPAEPKKSLRQCLDDLQSDNDNTRAAAVQLLGNRIADKRDVLPALAEAANDASWLVRQAAARSLAKMGKDAVPDLCLLLDDDCGDVRWTAFRSLAELGPDALPAIPRLLLALKENDPDLCDAVVRVLNGIGKDAVPAMLGGLEGKDPHVRRAALVFLSDRPPEAKRSLPSVIAALNDNDVGVRRAAVRCLSNLTDEPAAVLPALTQTFRKEQVGDVRRAAGSALGHMGRPAVPVLIASLGDVRNDVRRSAVMYLGNMGYDAWEALPYLYYYKNDPNRWMRSMADSAIEDILTNSRGYR